MNGTLVRIWTEDLNLDRIKVEVGHYFSAYTIFSASGVWDGTSENSLVSQHAHRVRAQHRGVHQSTQQPEGRARHTHPGRK